MNFKDTTLEHKGDLLVDATGVNTKHTLSTHVDLLNISREKLENTIDILATGFSIKAF